MKREGKTLLLKFIRRTVNSLTKIYWWNRRNCCFRNQRISLPMSIFSPSHCECVLYQILRAIASKILELTRTGTTPTLDSSYGCREEENVSQPCRHDRIGASDDGAHALVLRIPWSPLSLSLSPSTSIDAASPSQINANDDDASAGARGPGARSPGAATDGRRSPSLPRFSSIAGSVGWTQIGPRSRPRPREVHRHCARRSTASPKAAAAASVSCRPSRASKRCSRWQADAWERFAPADFHRSFHIGNFFLWGEISN